jgi:hypothetical protein
MAKRKETEIASVSEIPQEVLGAVVAADLCQIEADAKTHPDPDAQRRILFAVGRLREIAQAEISSEFLAKLSEISAMMNRQEAL